MVGFFFPMNDIQRYFMGYLNFINTPFYIHVVKPICLSLLPLVLSETEIFITKIVKSSE